MNIKELIEVLSQFNPQTRAIVAGYENGFDDISEVKEISIVLNINKFWYYGSHEGLDQLDEKDKKELQNEPQVKAIFLGGRKPFNNYPINNVPIKVKSLIEVLLPFDPQTRVVVLGYEDGFNDISKIEEMSIILNTYEDWYDGRHQKQDEFYEIPKEEWQSPSEEYEEYEEYEERLGNKSPVRAIFLGGRNPFDDSYPNDNYWR